MEDCYFFNQNGYFMDRSPEKTHKVCGFLHEKQKENTMITTQLHLERCLCKNPNGTYNIFDALRYNANSRHPHLDWNQIQIEYAFMFEQIQFYFITDEPATDRDGINLILELARRLQF
jgi:hypothetical protein